MKRKLWSLDAKAASNLLVVLVGITFFFILYRWDGVRSNLSVLLDVLSPFIIGFVIAYLLNTPTNYLERKLFQELRHPRTWAIASVFFIAFIIIMVLVELVVPQVGDSVSRLLNNVSYYLENLNTMVQDLIKTFHIEGNVLADLMGTYNEIVQKAASFLSSSIPDLLNLGVALGNGVVTGLTAIIASIYMLAGKDRLIQQIKKLFYALFPAKQVNQILRISNQANQVFVGFINGKLVDSAIIGILCFLLSMIFRIPYAVLLSVIVGITNVIPFFGPIIGAIPCLMILIIVDPLAALRFGILIIALQQFDGNILGPKILGDSTGLSAIWVLVAIVVGGGLFGFPGMILGVPTFAVLYSLVREWADLRLAEKNIDATGNLLESEADE